MESSWKNIIVVNMGLTKSNMFEKLYVQGTIRLVVVLYLFFCEKVITYFENNLQATASAADPSSIRRVDGWMDRWIQKAIAPNLSWP